MSVGVGAVGGLGKRLNPGAPPRARLQLSLQPPCRPRFLLSDEPGEPCGSLTTGCAGLRSVPGLIYSTSPAVSGGRNCPRVRHPDENTES